MGRLIRTACALAILLGHAVLGAAGPTVKEVAPGDLAAALRRAQPGATLRLLPGSHPGPIRIDVPLRLEAEPGAVIEGSGKGTVLTLAADGITVSGVEVRGSGSDLSQDDAGVLLLESGNITVERCRIEAAGFGIYLKAGGGHTIAENEIQGDPALPVARRGNGIHLWYSAGNTLRDNRVAGVRDGVYLSFAHRNLITGNEGSQLRYGIHYMYSERNRLIGNRFSECIGGIALMFSLGNHIEANETVGNRDFGILCQQLEHSVVVRNRSARNGRGFYLQNSAQNEFTENQLAGNGVGAYLTAGSEQNTFSANHFDGNLVQIYRDHAGDNRWSRDGRGNFWSDYIGVDWDGDGVGETPYRLETAASALMARHPEARWFWMSPVMALVDWWEGRLLGPRADAFDHYPMVGHSDR